MCGPPLQVRGENRRGLVPPVPGTPAPPPPGASLTQQHGLGTALAQDGLEDAQERLGELLLQVVLRVDGQAVLQHEQGVLRAERRVTPGPEQWGDWGWDRGHRGDRL